MRVKKYKQQQQNQYQSGTSGASAHNSTRNKTSSQRGLSDLLRNQSGNNTGKKVQSYHQSKYSKQGGANNATIENRSAAGPQQPGNQT
jgi:hypothetical protein